MITTLGKPLNLPLFVFIIILLLTLTPVWIILTLFSALSYYVAMAAAFWTLPVIGLNCSPLLLCFSLLFTILNFEFLSFACDFYSWLSNFNCSPSLLWLAFFSWFWIFEFLSSFVANSIHVFKICTLEFLFILMIMLTVRWAKARALSNKLSYFLLLWHFYLIDFRTPSPIYYLTIWFI